MELLLLGLVFGLVTVAMPGPVSISLIQVATTQGRAAGSRAGLGIVGGDVLLAFVAVALVSGGASLPGGVFTLIQWCSALTLVGLGVLLLARPVATQGRASQVAQPGRTFLLLTTLMPSTLGSWLAILAAMPFAGEWLSLAAFSVGIVLTSCIWHPALGVGAGTVGQRLTPRILTASTRLGGVATVGLGAWAVLSTAM